jgi:microcompartment protein CcmK/EutM
MFLGEVLGTVVSPVQIPILDGRKLLLVRTLTPDGRRTGKTRIAIDHVQAGVGDRVLCLDEGNGARGIFQAPDGPVKTVVVGVVDYVDVEAGRVYDHREPKREVRR